VRIDTQIDLVLESVGLGFRFENFQGGMGVTRKPINDQQPRVAHNTQGVAKRLARWYEPKQSWAFSLALNEVKFEVLQYLRLRQTQLIREGQSSAVFGILLEDRRRSFIEVGTRTRASTGAAISPPDSASVEYFGSFRVLLKFQPDFYRKGSKDNKELWLVDFQALELEKEAAI
jgi:hypothetical protein